jgi:hypothetical protein
MGLFESYSFFDAIEYELSADTHDLAINSNKIVIVSSADIKLTGIKKPEIIEGEIALFFIRNAGNFKVTLSARDVLSLEPNQFQMDADIVLKNGEVAVFLINDTGLFSYGVLLSNNKHYYTVRDANAADVLAADELVYDSVPIVGVLNYKVLAYSTPHTFVGTETWVQDMTSRDVANNIWNPVYFNLAAIDAYDIGRDLAEAARANVKTIQDNIIETWAGHLFKNALTWTALQKLALTLYVNKLKFYGSTGNVGVVRQIAISDKVIVDAPAMLTVLDPFTGATYNVDVMTSAMLQHLIDLLNIYKKKYPDGTI